MRRSTSGDPVGVTESPTSTAPGAASSASRVSSRLLPSHEPPRPRFPHKSRTAAQGRSPRWVVHVAEANIGDAAPPADLHRSRRGVDGSDGEASLLEVQRRTASARAQVQYWTACDEREEFLFPPVPAIKAAEEPFRMQRWTARAALYLENEVGNPPAFEVVGQRAAEGVLRWVDHRRIMRSASALSYRISPRRDRPLSCPGNFACGRGRDSGSISSCWP